MIKDNVTQEIIVEIPDVCDGGDSTPSNFEIKNNWAVFGKHNTPFTLNASNGGNWNPTLFDSPDVISVPASFTGKNLTGKIVLRLYANWSGSFNINNFAEVVFSAQSFVSSNKIQLPPLNLNGDGTVVNGTPPRKSFTSGQFNQFWMQGTVTNPAQDISNASTIECNVFTNTQASLLGWELRFEYLEVIQLV